MRRQSKTRQPQPKTLFDKVVPPIGQKPAKATPRRYSTFPGLRAYLDRLLDETALAAAEKRLNPDATHQVIQRTRDRLNRLLAQDPAIDPALSDDARDLLAWFRFFADEHAFAQYVSALNRASTAFAALPAERAGWQPPLLVHFRPLAQVYRWRQVEHGSRIVVSPPMIVFDDTDFERLGRVILGHRRAWAPLTRTMMDDAYQTLAAQFEAAGGQREQTSGQSYDLATLFEQVNRDYFDGRLSRPKLTWSQRMTGCKFGHYEPIGDTVMISRTLDHPDVPDYVIEHVMHHELLHKKLGVEWRGGRQHAHTPAFRRLEKQFPRYVDAAAFLESLATRISAAS